MDWQSIFNLAIGLIMASLGWFAREIWDSIKDVRRDIKDLDARMHTDFVRKDDFKDAMAEHKNDMNAGFREIKDMIGLLFSKLDKKMDK
jgi:hypothetical protein